ncbi:acriflavin resistance protein [Vibrio sp. 10N.286.49.C2]|uniref:efflux RND transporter periplasmic adaptor subunit n=1 Tax=unclassified Vibrio TaxID=2614977 RepID=UPI000C815534|nr:MULTISPECIES: HlyD family secretion protein [unclassified Vibrio]PMH27587.1 acriflavin resistance protein [Vibrio sp. 10N.286.49.C2]PMH53013.1 acriflavin resistance protein [Vibrio sp. 10N.286.49.B1]PMH82641.1 acriflavin resistance protein [Vibrio sp. 10N.286.48.B7]
MTNINKKLLFFPALAVGVVALIAAINLRPDIPTKPAGDRARVVETLTMQPQFSAPLAVGFGRVTPKLEWKAISEVSGEVVYKHPNLEKGNIVSAGTEVLRIDPLDYELKVSQAIADLKSSETQLARIDQEEINLKQTLTIELNRLKLARSEYQRRADLNKRGLSSQSDVDTQKQNMLSQQKLVQELENQMALLPDERDVALAVVNVNKAKEQEAQRLLAKTIIYLPETLRIAEVDAEINQVVNLQQAMVTAHGTEMMEVEAQLSIHDLQLIADTLNSSARNSGSNNELQALSASIELSSGSLQSSWPAKVVRVSETVDPNQATAGVILEIAQSTTGNGLSDTPLLVNGMFVKAKIEGQPQQAWLIPERALHGDKVYLMSVDNTLQIKPVVVEYRRDNQVAVRGEFQQGDKLVLNDLLPAIEGMLLRDISVAKDGMSEEGDES